MAAPKQQISLLGAVGIGVASMLGAGVFSVFSVAYAKTFDAYWLALLLAGLVASLNAGSIYSLAKQIDRPGGVYSYSRHYLGKSSSFLAGFAFVFGKIGSIAAIAWIFGEYVWPSDHRIAATVAVVLLTALNLLGINRTAAVATGLAVLATTYLGLSAVAGNLAPAFKEIDISSVLRGDLGGVLPAASLLFFAFAGYARVATLGSEVKNPKRNIPRAIVIAMAVVFLVYVLLSSALIRVVPNLETASASLLALNQIVNPWMPVWVTTFVAALASLGSMLALLAGVSRTAATMAEDQELPPQFAIRNRFGAPWLSEAIIAFGALALLWFSDYLQWVVGFSSLSVLLYYAIGHLSVLRQPASERSMPTLVATVGLALCLVLLISVPGPAVWISSIIIAVAMTIRWVVARRLAR